MSTHERSSGEGHPSLYAVLDRISDGFLAIDSHWTITYINRRAAQQAYREPAELTGRNLWEAVPTLAGTAIETYYRQAMAEKRPVEFEFHGVVHDVWYAVKVYPSPDGLTVYWQDVSARRAAEAALRDSESRYRALFEGMTEGFALHEMIFDADGRPVDYRFLEINPSFERLTGLKRKEVIGRVKRDVLPNDDPHWVEIYGRVALTGEPVHFENHSRALNRWYEVFAFRPAPRQFAVLFVEITERKRAEDALRRGEEQLRSLNAELEQRVSERTVEARQLAGRLRAMASELTQAEQRERQRLATILHDHIQQLLVAARMQIGVLQDQRISEATRRIAHRVDEIVLEALDASRSLTMELSPPVLRDAGLAAALDWLARRKLEEHRLTVEVQTDNQAEPADEDVRLFLFTAVRELLLNVVKHAGTDRARVHMALANADEVTLTVEDAGRGFDPATMKSHVPPTGGFGLFSIQQRLETLGGRLEVQSAPGQGTRITLFAPVKNRSHRASNAPEADPHAGIPRIRILLADDHRIVREGLTGIVQFEPDMEIIGEAVTGREALEMARQFRPDVIIMDVTMHEGLNGIEATRLIKAELPDVCIVGLSMHAEESTANALRNAGASAYLTKGGQSEHLIGAIRAGVAARRTAKEARP